MTEHLLRARVTVMPGHDDAARLDEDMAALYSRIKDLPIHSLTRAAAAGPPDGAKGEALTLGALLITLSPVLLAQLFSLFQTLVGPSRRIHVEVDKVSIEFTADKRYSEDDILQLVERISKSRHTIDH